METLSHDGGEPEAAAALSELDDAELALMLATATGMGRAQMRELIQRRARERNRSE